MTMTAKLNAFSEVVAKANDEFSARHHSIDTIMGIMDKTLRNQGMAADAVTIDAVKINKKIVFLLRDQDDAAVEVALGNKVGDIHSTTHYLLASLTVDNVVEILEHYFIVN